MKVIPISYNQGPGAAASKKGLTLTHRNMLKGTGVLVNTLTIGNPLALLAPSVMWVVELRALNKAEGDTLLQVERVLFPHARLSDAAYTLLVKDLGIRAVQDAQTATQLHGGIAALDKPAGGSFVKTNAKRRLAAVKAMEGRPFFSTVRGQCMTSLYGNEMAFATFSYPGSTWEEEGYITRGFQDLKWLPAPPVGTSPPPFLG